MFRNEKAGLIISGIIFAILGALVLANPESSLKAIVVILGILNLALAAASGYIAWKTNSPELRSREILNAFLDAVVGLIFLFSPFTGVLTLSIMFAFWIIFISISNLTNAFTGVQIGGFARILYVILGIFGITAGFSMLFEWGLAAESFIWFVGFFLLAEGIVSIISGFMIKNDNV